MCFTIYTMDWVLQKEQNTTSRRTRDTGNSSFCYIYYMLVHSACIFFYSISVALYRYYFGIDLYILMLSSYFHFYNDNIQTKILHMRVINNEKIRWLFFQTHHKSSHQTCNFCRYIDEYSSQNPDVSSLSVNRVKFKAIEHCFDIIGFKPEVSLLGLFKIPYYHHW